MDSDAQPGAESPGLPLDEQQSRERQLAAEDQRLRAILDRQIWPTADEDDW
ncbi:hypothetical protein ACFO0M_18400 [Micromonospora mangrovi]|uniref:Transposase n=2 Tax=Micromonospora TaxID=1873 RepID=A0AAU8H7G3_9ACTN